MTTTTDADVIQFPDVQSRTGASDPASPTRTARAPAREELPPRAVSTPLPPEEARKGRRWSMPPVGPLWARLQLLMAGASVLDAQPPGLLAIWARHTVAAQAWRKGLWSLRWPRYCWGAVHTWLFAPVCYYIAWAADSAPKAIVNSAVVYALLLCFHIVSL